MDDNTVNNSIFSDPDNPVFVVDPDTGQITEFDDFVVQSGSEAFDLDSEEGSTDRSLDSQSDYDDSDVLTGIDNVVFELQTVQTDYLDPILTNSTFQVELVSCILILIAANLTITVFRKLFDIF